MKKKIVGKAINRILLAVVTINLFVVFLPRWIATILEVLTLGGLLYEYLPAITGKLYETSRGTFTEKRWIRLLILCFAIPGYFIAFQSQYIVYLLLFILAVAVLALGFPLAYAWNKENKGVPPDQQSFWKVMAVGEGKNLAKEWEEYKNSPNKLSTFCWYYAPGLGLSAMGFCFFAIFLLFSWYSQFFTLVFIGWLLGNIFAIFTRRDKSPDMENKLLKLPSAMEGGWKGTFGFVCIFTGFAIPGMFISYELANFPFSTAVNFQYPLYSPLVYLLLKLPPYIYQFVFWYAILKRFPYFLHDWKSGLQSNKTLSLPTGQIYAFIGSCISPFYIFVVPSLIRSLHLQSSLIIKAYLPLWFIINFAFVALIVHTLIKWRGKKTSKGVHKDNIKIPLALSAQFMFLFGAGYILENSILNEISLTCLLISIILILLFFVQDWQNFLKHRYREGLTSEILGILPVFVILTIAIFITFVWLQPIFYLVLTLTIIAVSLIIIDISNKYRMLCCTILHKFYVPLTDRIFKALNIIKEYCNRLFLALKRKEVITETINGVLLAVVTINIFIDFLPKYLATFLGLLILCKLLYEYLPVIARKLSDDFTEKWWVRPVEKVGIRLVIVCFAAPGYFYVEVMDILLITNIIIALVVSFPFAAWWEKNAEQPFWNVIAEVEGTPALKNLGKYLKNFPDSLTKNIAIFFWWYLPGLLLSSLCIFVFGVFYVISIYSQFFTIIFVGWILNNISTKFKWKSKNPDIEKNLLTLPLAIEGGIKGFFICLFIFGGFLSSGVFIFNLFYQFPCSKAINFLYLLMLSPPGIYQFVFWYAMLKRFPSFIYCWKKGLSQSKSLSLPMGGLYAFIISCIYVCALLAFHLRNWKWIYLLLSFTSFVYIVLILQTIKKWMKKEIVADIRKDNIRLPLAFFVQLTPLFLAFHRGDSICSENSLLCAMLLFGFGVSLSSLFFIQDWWNFLKHRYGSGMRRESLRYLPLFVFLLLADFLAFILGSGYFFYLFLPLSIIAVFLIFLEIAIRKKAKQLSRAKESCKANSINHNEEKK